MKRKTCVVGFVGTSCDAWLVFDYIHNEYYEYRRKCDALRVFNNIIIKHYELNKESIYHYKKELKEKLKNPLYKHGIKLNNIAELRNVEIHFSISQ